MITKEIEKIAVRVLLNEASALIKMSENLPSDFAKTVKAILKIKGRVVVSGVGKSGHIGKKISATLSSIGTPSFFVHATEASHGDLGAITEEDFFLLISNSGETSELADIVAHSRRFNIPLASISSVPSSTLVKASDYRLILPKASEACSIGMAPTTSTIMSLALGDSLAVALMECRDFKPEDFYIFHPGGKLGSQTYSVEQLMRPKSEMAILDLESSMQEVILRMTETGYGVAVLIDKKGLVSGVISDGDLRRNAENLLEQKPKSIASCDPVMVSPNDLIGSAVNKMESEKVYTVVVVENKKPIGLLRMHDLLKAGIA